MFQTAFTLAQQRQESLKRFGSGIRLLDQLIDGGYETGLCYLLYGSQFCTKLLLRSIASALQQISPDQGVVVIDGNNGIRPTTLIEYLKTTPTIDPPAVYLERLHVARAFTTQQLISLLEEVSTILQNQRAPILFVNGFIHLLQEEEDAEQPSGNPPEAPPDPLVYRRAQLAAQLKQLAFSQQVAVVASADGPKRPSESPLRIGQAAHHSFHVLIHHAKRDNLDSFILVKHPVRSYQARSTSSSHLRRRKFGDGPDLLYYQTSSQADSDD